ncbi:PHD-finger motif containing protein [Coccidioides posadasii C735 delta SOWgp]|uniref:PHD-finger motif containing protein n=1 Tax=Coccidioides posadasii (strain C735) TaxID=222929 RepID=C5P9Z0_COCP7|nr:PHD-finger motif containing protein [Coccidioides posadasii C735 delta SOWgp]EER26552.1 PHD-finger motif containing protein [Coccidioides posadasii C735 delta SOWgp]|eukprot:XP_003068697.1 PHD-finger motif containing protein [Coccidioides posadasii C735 delta SOWgp]
MDLTSSLSSLNPSTASSSDSDQSKQSPANRSAFPLPGGSTTAETSNVQSQSYVPLPSVSLSPLSSITPLSSSTTESIPGLTALPQLVDESTAGAGGNQEVQPTGSKLEQKDFGSFSASADASLLSISGARPSSTELSSITSNSFPTPSTIGVLPRPVQPTISTAASTTTMPRPSAKPVAAPLKKIAPAPPKIEEVSDSTPGSVPKSGKQQNRTKKPTQKRSKKRKARTYDDDGDGIIKAGDSSSDESDEFTPIATQTKSGRQIHRPSVFAHQQGTAQSSAPGATGVTTKVSGRESPPRKKKKVRKGKEANITCEHCQRGHSPSGNPIVFCDDCNGGWHRFCHDPPIEVEVVNVKESQWFCRACRPVKAPSPITPVASTMQSKPVATATVYDTKFLESENLVGGSKFTRGEKLGYLARLSHAALVNLLIRISDESPELPIFPANVKDLRPSLFIAPSIANPSATTIKSSLQDTTTQTTPLSSVGTSITSQLSSEPPNQPQSSTPPTSDPDHPHASTAHNEGDHSEDEFVSEHRLYPKPGNGFLLPPDPVDLDMLLEDPDCPTFSHALHGPAKLRTEGAEHGAPMGVV